jgi:hypothetical protein
MYIYTPQSDLAPALNLPLDSYTEKKNLQMSRETGRDPTYCHNIMKNPMTAFAEAAKGHMVNNPYYAQDAEKKHEEGKNKYQRHLESEDGLSDTKSQNSDVNYHSDGSHSRVQSRKTPVPTNLAVRKAERNKKLIENMSANTISAFFKPHRESGHTVDNASMVNCSPDSSPPRSPLKTDSAYSTYRHNKYEYDNDSDSIV